MTTSQVVNLFACLLFLLEALFVWVRIACGFVPRDRLRRAYAELLVLAALYSGSLAWLFLTLR